MTSVDRKDSGPTDSPGSRLLTNDGPRGTSLPCKSLQHASTSLVRRIQCDFRNAPPLKPI